MIREGDQVYFTKRGAAGGTYTVQKAAAGDWSGEVVLSIEHNVTGALIICSMDDVTLVD
jgi:hypothetical protein